MRETGGGSHSRIPTGEESTPDDWLRAKPFLPVNGKVYIKIGSALSVVPDVSVGGGQITVTFCPLALQRPIRILLSGASGCSMLSFPS